jgi:hypothetical protein
MIQLSKAGEIEDEVKRKDQITKIKARCDLYTALNDFNISNVIEDAYFEIDPKYLLDVSPRRVGIVCDPCRINSGDAIITTGAELIDDTLFYYHIIEGLRYRHTSMSISRENNPVNIRDRFFMHKTGTRMAVSIIPVAFRSDDTYMERTRLIENWLRDNLKHPDGWYDFDEAFTKGLLTPLFNGTYLNKKICDECDGSGRYFDPSHGANKICRNCG